MDQLETAGNVKSLRLKRLLLTIEDQLRSKDMIGDGTGYHPADEDKG